MKRYITIAVLLGVLILVFNLYLGEKQSKERYLEESKEWKVIAEQEKQIPLVNERAKDFVEALHHGEHKKYLTGQSLEEYNKAMEEYEEDEHSHTETNLQSTRVLISNTENTEKGVAESDVLYQLEYEGILDNEEQGVVNRRILTFVMDITWDLNAESGSLVERYNVELLENSMGTELDSSYGGGVEDEE